MNEILCLYLDNDARDLAHFKARLELAWRGVSRDVSLRVETTQSIDEALQKLMTSIQLYHLFVADLYFPKAQGSGRGREHEITQGNTVIAEARRLARNLSHPLRIIALSVGGHQEQQDSIEAGADHYLSKLVLLRDPGSPEQLTSVLSELLGPILEQVAPPADTLSFDRDDLSLRATVESIGPSVLLRLVRRLIPDPVERVRLGFVRAGLSGAAVVRAECDAARPGARIPETERLLLKISRDGGALSDEYQRRGAAARFPPNLFIMPRDHEPVSAAGWHAIAYPFVDGVGTLVDWLAFPRRTADDIARTMDMLFVSTTQPNVYRHAHRLDDERGVVLVRRNLTTSRSARVLLALKELGELARDFGRDAYDDALIRRFISGGRIGNVSEEETPRGAYTCRAHGDLHARNVLVDHAGRPYLIDPANISDLHWASDLARLCADLLVSGLSAGVRSHLWEDLRDWLDICRGFVASDSPTPPPNCPAAVTAAIWVGANLHRIVDGAVDPSNRWFEFVLAMAVEFMRSAYRVLELPSPKRVLGLLAACEALKACERHHRTGGRGIMRYRNNPVAPQALI